MGLFNQDDQAAPEIRGGFFKRLRSPRATFIESTQAAEPKFKPTGRAVNPQVTFLGRALSGDDIEDVESTSIVESRESTPTPSVHSDSGSTSADPDPASLARPFVPPVFERPSFESLSASIKAREGAEISQPPHPIEHRPSATPAQSPQTDATLVPAVAVPAHAPEPVEQDRAIGVAKNVQGRASVEHATPGRSEDDHDVGEDVQAIGTTTGRPELVSAESLPEFKRILTAADEDAALRIPASARKEFIAVELQPGIAISVATSRFCEKAQYATFIKDLSNNDVYVREEMVATEAVIAAIYAGKTGSASSSGVGEASAAIGRFRDIIEAAHAYGASDVHFEPREFQSEVEVRFRVNGDLYTFRHMPKAIVRRALFAAYSDLVQRNTNSGNSFQPSAPQSAMIPLVVKTDTVNLRWQSSPLVGGYDVALRLLDGNFKNYRVLLPKDMGFEQSQLELIDTLNYVSGGITALTGETGSGKTTTLRALSYMLPDRELKKQFAVSEPSEYPMPWLSEYSIIRRPDETNEEANRKYAEVIRTLMRQDPDDLTIQEVRDEVVMGLVAELALTGHPVRFSLHAGDIIAAIMRMAGGRLRLPIDELAAEGFINAVGNQKLIPTLCDHCKLPAEDVMSRADLEILRAKFGLDTSRMACRNMEGCPHCRLDGLFTRLGKVAGGTKRPSLAAELYRPTPEFLDRVAVRDWAGARRIWRGERRTGFDNADMTGKTLYEHALFKASQGLIDPQFINRSMQSFAQYRVMPGVDGVMV